MFFSARACGAGTAAFMFGIYLYPACVLVQVIEVVYRYRRFMMVLYEIYWYNKTTVTVMCCMKTM